MKGGRNGDGAPHVSCPGCEGAETGSKEYADISYINGEVKRMQNVVDDPAGSHEARIYCPANNTAKRVPCSMVKPVPEFLGKCKQMEPKICPQLYAHKNPLTRVSVSRD